MPNKEFDSFNSGREGIIRNDASPLYVEDILVESYEFQSDQSTPKSLQKLMQTTHLDAASVTQHVDEDFDVNNPSRYALSRSGSIEERRNIYGDVLRFLDDQGTKEFIEDTFHAPGKSFKKRPPLRIVPHANGLVSGDPSSKYIGLIFPDLFSSMFFVIENEYGPIASAGFNQFHDGVELRYAQGVSSAKIGRKSAEDLNRLKGWEEKLTSLVERYGEYKRLPYALILPASENMWVGRHFPKDRAEQIDRRASGRGYQYDNNLRRFIKPLAASQSAV